MGNSVREVVSADERDARIVINNFKFTMGRDWGEFFDIKKGGESRNGTKR